MSYIILICARESSKGVPKKNIRKLAGKPLLAWSIEISKMVTSASSTIVSTDSEEIASIAKDYGAEVPFIRPTHLSQDDSSEWLVWQHAMDYINTKYVDIDGLIVIPPTAPLRNITDIENCIDEFEKGNVDVVITVTDAHRNPYFNMIKIDSNGYSSLVISPENNIIRRQDSPTIYDVTTVAYIISPKFIHQGKGVLSGRVRSVYVPPERAIDIDTMLDFQIAECLMLGNKE